MTSELFTVFGQMPIMGAPQVATTSSVAVLYSDLWQSTPASAWTSSGITYIQLPMGSKLKVWDIKLMDTTPDQVFTVDIATFDYDTTSGGVVQLSTLFPVNGTLSGWTTIGKDMMYAASGSVQCCHVYEEEQGARPMHIIDSPDGEKFVGFIISESVDTSGATSTSGYGPTFQYTLEITDEVQAVKDRY